MTLWEKSPTHSQLYLLQSPASSSLHSLFPSFFWKGNYCLSPSPLSLSLSLLCPSPFSPSPFLLFSFHNSLHGVSVCLLPHRGNWNFWGLGFALGDLLEPLVDGCPSWNRPSPHHIFKKKNNKYPVHVCRLPVAFGKMSLSRQPQLTSKHKMAIGCITVLSFSPPLQYEFYVNSPGISRKASPGGTLPVTLMVSNLCHRILLLVLQTMNVITLANQCFHSTEWQNNLLNSTADLHI